MQQTSLLLDIGDLTSITDIASDDIQQLEQQIALCRASDRPDLAAPYALQLCQYHNQHDEREHRLWFDAIAEDDIFLVKALVASGFDINTQYYYSDGISADSYGSGVTEAIKFGSENSILFFIKHSDINLDVVGYSEAYSSYTRLAPKYPADRYVIPFHYIYYTEYRELLDTKHFNPDIEWGWGMTAFKDAVYSYDVELIEWLLAHGCNPNQQVNSDSEESIFGWLINDYINSPSSPKLDIVKLMFKHGASTSAKNWEGYPVLYVAWQEKNQPLIDLFGLGYFQEEWEELEQEKIGLADEITQIRMKLVEQNIFDEHAKSRYVRPDLRIGDDHSHYRAPTLKVSILHEMRIKGEFIPAGWITDLSIIQQDEDILISIEQQDHQVAAMTVTLPDELHYISYPFTSSIAMGLHFIQCPLRWWQEVEHYLHRYHITLIDRQFFDTSRDQLEQGYC